MAHRRARAGQPDGAVGSRIGLAAGAAASLQQALKLCHVLGFRLGQSLKIYQRIGASRARQVQEPSATTSSITMTTSTAMTKPARRRDDAGPGRRKALACLQSSEQLGPPDPRRVVAAVPGPPASPSAPYRQ